MSYRTMKNFLHVPWPGWLSWLERHPVHQSIVGPIPDPCTCLNCGFNPWSRHVQEATSRRFSPSSMFLSLPFSLLPSLSKSNEKMYWGEDKIKFLAHHTLSWASVKETLTLPCLCWYHLSLILGHTFTFKLQNLECQPLDTAVI